jgi:ligand-binding sensor domain-containing protein
MDSLCYTRHILYVYRLMKYLLVSLCILNYTALQGQQLAHFNITQQQGLPSNTVYNIFQDSKGFIWVATENGVARFNGVDFTSYDQKKVRSKAVSGLFEDKVKS